MAKRQTLSKKRRSVTVLATISNNPPLADFDFTLLDKPRFNEKSVCEVLVTPLLASLGYLEQGPNRIERDQIFQHPYIKIGSKERSLTEKPDYVLYQNDKPFFVLDAKGPNENIRTGSNVEQAFSYAFHPEINTKYFALCNGRKFTLFDTQGRDKLILEVSLKKLDQYWKRLQECLAVGAAPPVSRQPTATPSPTRTKFDYRKITPPKEVPYANLRKQAARRHHGVHPYFTRQAWTVVHTYIDTFTQHGDVVLDPYGGTGVTFIEALMAGRKAIHIDLNPLCEFLLRALITPVSEKLLRREFDVVYQAFEKQEPKTDEEAETILKNRAYPRGIRLPRSSDVDFIEQLFSRRQLAQLALLKALILRVRDESVRNALLLMFSGLINKINLTYHSSKGRTPGRGNSSMFQYYRYRIAPKPATVDPKVYFVSRLKSFLAAKNELKKITPEQIQEAVILKGTAINLGNIKSGSVDYIYTDPPYASKIQYLDLSIIFTAWLDLPVTPDDYDQEIIEGGERKKGIKEYSDGISKSISEMARVLKYDRWLSFVFAHSDPKYWHMIVKAAEQAGFEYIGSVSQSSGQRSYKKRQRPFTVLSGQLIINFRKAYSPRAKEKINLRGSVREIALTAVESVIAQNHGATYDQITDHLVLSGLEHGFLDLLAKEFSDIKPILDEAFDFDEVEEKYHIKKDKSFQSKIPLDHKVTYFVKSYLRRMERHKKDPTFEEVVFNVMPLLKNGKTPSQETLKKVLQREANRVSADRWRLRRDKDNQLDLL